ncbi:MAG: PT domain-containing protein [Clostridia bacterium]|nr:PT domain-containing protein [Clostridia bacterium]
MKKTLETLLIFILTLSTILLTAAYAENAPADDPTTARAYPYDVDAALGADIWLNAFDAEGECIGSDYVVFNAAAPLKGLGFPVVFAGKEENDQDATVRFELFGWDTNEKKTLEGTPVFSREIHFNGDTRDVDLKIDDKLAAGQYLFKISQVTGQGEWTEFPAHYSVLPSGEISYSESTLLYGAKGRFAFYADFEATDGVTDYFKTLEGKSNQIDIQKEKTIIARNGDTPHEIAEFGILTPEIPDGQVLYSITLANAPTWNNTNGDSDASFTVYKWKGDYETSVEGNPVASVEVLDHKDNSDMTARFDVALRYGHRYLIVVEPSNDGKIGYWEGRDARPDGWEFFEFGEELSYNPTLKAAYAVVGDLGPEPTEAPTKEPAPTPEVTEKPTAAPTEVPAVTDAPAPTDVPVVTEEASKPVKTEDNPPGGSDDKSGSGANMTVPIIVTSICGVIVIASVVAIILALRKKK